MRLVLLGPNGQLASEIRGIIDRRDRPFDLLAAGRDVVDVGDLPALREFLAGVRFDVLVNCAGYHKTDEAEAEATQAFAVNAHAVAVMADSCARKKARFFHFSTDYVFGVQDRDEPYGEDDFPGPVNVYGASKSMGESLARMAYPDTTILRLASLFGAAGASGRGENFVETIIRLGRERGELRVVDDQTMSPTSAADVAEILLTMIARPVEPGIYHVVNSGSATWFEFASEILRLAGVPAVVHPVTSAEFPRLARRPRYSVLDNAKVAGAVSALRPWREALSSYLGAKGHRS